MIAKDKQQELKMNQRVLKYYEPTADTQGKVDMGHRAAVKLSSTRKEIIALTSELITDGKLFIMRNSGWFGDSYFVALTDSEHGKYAELRRRIAKSPWGLV